MRSILAASVALLAGVCPARAQQPTAAPTFADVQPGGLPTVFVTDRAGRETTGRLVRITDSAVTIAVAGGERTFTPDEVSWIDRKGDSLRNGTLIGLGVGIGFGFLAAGIADCPDARESCPGTRALGFVMSAGVYSAIGAGIDAAITGRTRIWPPMRTKGGAGSGPVASVSPAGGRLFVGWRISR